jgi:hypothetical protein
LLPVLEAILHQFPFRILGVHTDNGSEYVNHRVTRLLGKLRVEFTRSRPNRSSDSALVEGKNRAIIRKHMGYGRIPRQYADLIQRFYFCIFQPLSELSSPVRVCRGAGGRAWSAASTSGQSLRTPYETLRMLPDGHRFLKEGLSWELLDKRAYAHSDTEPARRMKKAREDLMRVCKLESPVPPRFA